MKRILFDLGVRLRAVFVLLLAVVVLTVSGVAALSWRLAQGPLDIAWAARRIESAANLPDRPTRLSIGEAALEWSGFAEGSGRGFVLQLRDVRLVDRRDAPVARVDRIDLSVSLPRLLRGQVVPRALSASGIMMTVVRDAQGRVAIDLGGFDLADDAPITGAPTTGSPITGSPITGAPITGAPIAGARDTPGEGGGPTVQDTLRELARPVRRPGVRPTRPDLQHIEELAEVTLHNAVVVVRDPALQGALRLEVSALDLRRRIQGGVSGTAGAIIALGAARTTVALRAELAPDGGTSMQLAFTPVNAAAVQASAPGMATADTIDAAVQGTARIDLDPRLRPRAAALRLQAGAGRLRLAGAMIGFDSLAVEAEAAWDEPGWATPSRLGLPRLRAVVHAPGGAWPTTITAAGRAQIGPDKIRGEAEGTVDHVDFADLAALWPAPLGGHVRPWLIPNVTAGTARDGHAKLTFEASRSLSDASLTSIDASMKGEDVTIWWIRPVPPVEGAQAMLTMKSPAVLDIAVASARQGGMVLRNGFIHFTGMDKKDQFMELTAEVAGPVPEVLTLLKHPRLALLDRRPIPMRNPGGTMTGRLQVNAPMKDQLTFEDIRIETSSKVTDLRLGGLVAGRDLEQGQVQLDVNTETLRATGKAVVAGIPSDLVVEMDFRNGPPSQVVQRAHATGRATGRQLTAARFGPGTLMPAGSGAFTAKYQQRRDGTGDVLVTADLKDAALAVVGWRKDPGPPASATLRLLVKGDRMLGIDQLHAEGPGMLVDGRVDMVGTEPLLLILDRITLGSTQARGQVRFPATPAEPIRATLTGAVLDISTELRKPPVEVPPASSKGEGAWVADIRFDRVLLAQNRGLSGVVAHAENDGTRLSALTATSSGAEKVQVSLRSEGTGRRLAVRAVDGGALLQAADLVDTIRGGRLAVDAVYDDTKPSAPLSGTARLENFTVLNAPILGKLLQAVTIYGVVDALRGPGLGFTDMILPFRWEGGVLQLTEARAFSASLGITARGRIDTGRKALDIAGTVVPAYVLNSLLGRIPLVGRLFSNERGGGLVAVDYTLRGPLADPAVGINPLSALTPGFLRGLFHIFD